MRLQSRHALHEVQMNQIKAAASPSRRNTGLDHTSSSPSSGPRTPRRGQGKENDLVVGGNVLTPVKRVPLLANFEEWMKMATDNKINATNSWNFALIDYFHDMSLLKEGDGVNFQKASCTLDGCVKIYTSRVDSVATETGKLLSGLADSGNNKKKRDEEGEGEGEESEEEEIEGEDGVLRKKPKKKVRVPSSWLVYETNIPPGTAFL
jgi:condensin complex subunit 2